MTDTHREASRNHGAKSKGPATVDGKARTARNASRHQLTAESLVLSSEERAEFDRMFTAYLEQLQPQNEIETDLVEQMAAAKWRERRCWLHQTSLLEHNVSSMSRYLDDDLDDAQRFALALVKDGDTRRFQLLQRYEAMHARTWRRSWRDLLENRKLRNEPGKGLRPVDSIIPNPEDPAQKAA